MICIFLDLMTLLSCGCFSVLLMKLIWLLQYWGVYLIFISLGAVFQCRCKAKVPCNICARSFIHIDLFVGKLIRPCKLSSNGILS